MDVYVVFVCRIDLQVESLRERISKIFSSQELAEKYVSKNKHKYYDMWIEPWQVHSE